MKKIQKNTSDTITMRDKPTFLMIHRPSEESDKLRVERRVSDCSGEEERREE